MKNKKKEKLEKKVVEVALIQGTPMHQPVQQQSFNMHEFLPARQWHLQFSLSVMSNSLQPHGLQHTRLPHPSPTPRAYSNSCPSPQWCHRTSSSSVIPFSSHLQSFPASGFFQMSGILWHVIYLMTCHRDRGSFPETSCRNSPLSNPSNGTGGPHPSPGCHFSGSHPPPSAKQRLRVVVFCVLFSWPLCIFPPWTTRLSRCAYIFQLPPQLCICVSANPRAKRSLSSSPSPRPRFYSRPIFLQHEDEIN